MKKNKNYYISITYCLVTRKVHINNQKSSFKFLKNNQIIITSLIRTSAHKLTMNKRFDDWPKLNENEKKLISENC